MDTDTTASDGGEDEDQVRLLAESWSEGEQDAIAAEQGLRWHTRTESKAACKQQQHHVNQKKKKKLDTQLPSAPKQSVDWTFMRRLMSILQVVYPNDAHGRRHLLLGPVSLFLVSCLQLWVVSLTGGVFAGFYESITNDDRHQLLKVLFQGVAVTTASALLDALIKFIADIVAWQMRRALSGNLHSKYFDRLSFYHIRPLLDNPDQRITQDVDYLAQSARDILVGMVGSPLVLILYTYLTFTHISWYAPLVIWTYYVAGYVVTKFIMSPVANAVFEQEKLEGDYRFTHAHVRSSAESIAMCRAQELEQLCVDWRLGLVMRNQMRIALWRWLLNGVSGTFSYTAPILNYLLIGIPIVFFGFRPSGSAGNVSGFVAEASFYSIMLASGFSKFFESAHDIAGLAGYTARIGHLQETLDNMGDSLNVSPSNDEDDDPQGDGGDEKDDSDGVDEARDEVGDEELELLASYKRSPDPNGDGDGDGDSDGDGDGDGDGGVVVGMDGRSVSGPHIKLSGVTVFTPRGQPLVRDINLSMECGVNVLVMGPCGIGKSSIIRALNGIWPFKGTIVKPNRLSLIRGAPAPPPFPAVISATQSAPPSLFYLPQEPYVPYGSLLSQVMFPERRFSEAVLRRARQMVIAVGLESLLSREQDEDVYDHFVAVSSTVSSRPTPTSASAPSTHLSWTACLSPGEKQLLVFARLLYHSPDFAVLDEATSCLPEDVEEKLYRLCRERNITILSVGHRASLLAYHQRLLLVAADGTCELKDIVRKEVDVK
eukprot:TRINITY_DN2203_c0_g1_i1.p1 TRINITY_DN2203_c0_g1~~TRINITY_DN2203_c0_g1_i1.p1  ORF type:complete len:769 (-),score=149.37 TRINITY_DN2203_c0_g1_i1:112-2418(-)